MPREFRETVLFDIFSIRPVEDPHEVFFHLMEAIVVTLQHSRSQPPVCALSFDTHVIGLNICVRQPRLYDSRFAKVVGPPLPLPIADPDMSVLMRSFSLNSPPSRSRPLPVAPTPQVDDGPREGSKDVVESDPLGSAREAETHDTGDDDDDDDDGLTEYYTDQSLDSAPERSPSPTPAHLSTKKPTHEDHPDRGEGPSTQSSQSTQKQKIRSNDEEEDGRTPRGKSKQWRKDDAAPKSPEKGSDKELEVLRTEFSPQIIPRTPPRELRPDPYTGWSPTKRNIMVFIRSKTPGEEVNLKRALGEGTSKLEMR